jgi:sialic acid synthase SpsE
MKSIEVKDKIIGDGYSTFIVAEMAWSHDGSIEKAKKIIKAAAEANADDINLHITSLEDYMIPQYGSGRARVSAGKDVQHIYNYLKSINLDRKDWVELFQYAKKQGLIISAMCNDLPSVEFASDLEPDIYVISPSCFCEEDLIREIAEKKKPIFLRIGGAYLGEIERAIFLIKEFGNSDIALIHGFQNYPTKLENMNLKFIQSLKQMFSLPVGFADHTDGDSELALVVPLVALPLGANIIEKHITHDRSLRGEDFESALDPGNFKKFVLNLREIEKTFGSPSIKPFSEDEINYRQVLKKRTVANRDIKKNEQLTKDNMTFKRSDEGVYPDESKYLIGRTVKDGIKKNEPITWDNIL